MILPLFVGSRDGVFTRRAQYVHSTRARRSRSLLETFRVREMDDLHREVVEARKNTTDHQSIITVRFG